MKNIEVEIIFPEDQFNKIPNEFIQDLSLKYKKEASILYLGRIISLKTNGDKSVELEIRKDETPYWYAKSIVMELKNNEILFCKSDEVLSSEGRVNNIELPPETQEQEIINFIFITILKA